MESASVSSSTPSSLEGGARWGWSELRYGGFSRMEMEWSKVPAECSGWLRALLEVLLKAVSSEYLSRDVADESC